MTPVAFWDASMLVPLCVEQAPYSEKAGELLGQYRMCVWWGTLVEVESALCRLHRSNDLSDLEWKACQAELDRISEDWFLIEPSETVRIQARELLRRYPLRAGDSLQLAAALVWCEGRSHGQVFLSGDQRLAEVASLCGFTVP
jgi:predicted nucleic acid-binding protein